MQLLFDLLSSCSGLLKHAAATTPAAVTVPTLTTNVLQGLYAQGWTCALDTPQVAVADAALTAEAYDTRRPNRGRRCSLCRCASQGDAATALPLLRNPECST